MSVDNSPGWLKVVSLIVIDKDGSRSVRTVKSLRCFTEKFTELSDLELPNSTVTEVIYRSLMNFISAAWVMWRSYVVGGVIGGVSVVFCWIDHFGRLGEFRQDVSSWRGES